MDHHSSEQKEARLSPTVCEVPNTDYFCPLTAEDQQAPTLGQVTWLVFNQFSKVTRKLRESTKYLKEMTFESTPLDLSEFDPVFFDIDTQSDIASARLFSQLALNLRPITTSELTNFSSISPISPAVETMLKETDPNNQQIDEAQDDQKSLTDSADSSDVTPIAPTIELEEPPSQPDKFTRSPNLCPEVNTTENRPHDQISDDNGYPFIGIALSDDMDTESSDQFQTDIGDFEVLGTPSDDVMENIVQAPLTLQQIKSASYQKRVPEKIICLQIMRRGLSLAARPYVWRWQTGLINWGDSDQEILLASEHRRLQYEDLTNRWKVFEAGILKNEIPPEQEDLYRFVEENLSNIDKDVVRTDSQHPFYQTDGRTQMLRRILATYICVQDKTRNGFVQGMADLASVILISLQGDESDSFWMFTHLMITQTARFTESGHGMHVELQLLGDMLGRADPALLRHLLIAGHGDMVPCFRWLLVAFKREFEFADLCSIWDWMFAWACQAGPHRDFSAAQRPIAVAMLKSQPLRSRLMEQVSFGDIVNVLQSRPKPSLDVRSILKQSNIEWQLWG